MVFGLFKKAVSSVTSYFSSKKDSKNSSGIPPRTKARLQARINKIQQGMNVVQFYAKKYAKKYPFLSTIALQLKQIQRAIQKDQIKSAIDYIERLYSGIGTVMDNDRKKGSNFKAALNRQLINSKTELYSISKELKGLSKIEYTPTMRGAKLVASFSSKYPELILYTNFLRRFNINKYTTSVNAQIRQEVTTRSLMIRFKSQYNNTYSIKNSLSSLQRKLSSKTLSANESELLKEVKKQMSFIDAISILQFSEHDRLSKKQLFADMGRPNRKVKAMASK